MTLEQFTAMRRDELIGFFGNRFGKRWRQIVAHRAGLPPRTFQRWKCAPAMSLYRQVHRLEQWARSHGFQSSLDQQVQAAIEKHREFKEDAAKERDKAMAERNPRPSGPDEEKRHTFNEALLHAALDVAMSPASPATTDAGRQ